MKINFKTIRSNTLNFLFIIAYVNIFQMIFGPENSIAGVIFTIMMSASMVRDLTATPLRHLLIQSFILVWMAIAAFLVNTLPGPLSFLINFATLLVILYLFTYEYSSHMYFPYILSYLFLIFISPAGIEQLPARVLGMLAGALSIILYQWVKGRNRVVETTRDVLSEMIGILRRRISDRLKEEAGQPCSAGVSSVQTDISEIRGSLCKLCKIVYDRRKKVLCVSDASFSMIAVGRGLENLLILLRELPEHLNSAGQTALLELDDCLKVFLSFLHQETYSLPEISLSEAAAPFGRDLNYIRERLLHMTEPQNKTHYRKTVLSLRVRLQAALDLSPVRLVYALRTALLLSCSILLVQNPALPHGKWLIFTLASVSLPYADDIPLKMKNRLMATLIGGLVSVAVYSLVPSAAGRTAVMMLSGYLSFYLSDYKETFACSTVGALGGAVFMHSFGLQDVGGMFLIRLGYILLGIAAGWLVNCLLFPYSRAGATRQLWKKYKTVSGLLARVCRADKVDPQLYYHLVIQAYLQEEKLKQNALLENWEEFPALLEACREKVRRAHRSVIAERKDAPVFEAAHPA